MCLYAIFILSNAFTNAIIIVLLSSFKGNEARLYELITRHFLACLSEDAKGAETTVRLLLGAVDNTLASRLSSDEGEVFEAKGLVIHQRNYLEVYYPYEGWSEKYMPMFQLGEVLTPDKIEVRLILFRQPLLELRLTKDCLKSL